MTQADLYALIDSILVDMWNADFSTVDRFSYLIGARAALMRGYCSYSHTKEPFSPFIVIDYMDPAFEQAQARQYFGDEPGKWS